MKGTIPLLHLACSSSIFKLLAQLDGAKRVVVECHGEDVKPLVYTGGMEETLLNVGDYTDIQNVGGTFPVGEVISESKDLTQVSGELMVFSFADKTKHLFVSPQPFKIIIEKGIVVGVGENTPIEFSELLDEIRAEEEEVWVRECGLGLNDALTKDKVHSLVSRVSFLTSRLWITLPHTSVCEACMCR